MGSGKRALREHALALPLRWQLAKALRWLLLKIERTEFAPHAVEGDTPIWGPQDAKLLRELRSRQEHRVTGSVHKIPWKIKCLEQGLLHRTIALVEGAQCAWNHRNLLGSIVLSRSILETAAVGCDFYLSLKVAVETGDLTKIDEVAMNGIFSTRWPGFQSTHPPAKNILSLIDKLDKTLTGNKSSQLYRGQYDFLCEYAHPNWPGTHDLFAKEVDGSILSTSFDERLGVYETSISSQFAAGLAAAHLVYVFFDSVDHLLLKVQVLSEEHLEKLRSTP